MMNDLNNFVQYLRWSDSTLRCPLVWKIDYIRYLKDKAAPLVEQDKEIADAFRSFRDEELAVILFCPRVLWALTQDTPHVTTRQEMLSEFFSHRARRLNQQSSAANDSDESNHIQTHLSIDGVTIDFESFFELPGEFQSLAPAPTRRQETEYQRINSALMELQRAFPAVFAFVKDLTFRIAVRFRPDRPHFNLFGSFTEYPGTMLIVNPWRSKADDAQMIEAIVHENIHHAIAMFETVRHDLTPGLPASSAHKSPWTGNLLTCHQFVEACFVWWGLYQMWLNWPLASSVPEDRARALCDRSLKGFIARPATELVRELGTTTLPNDTTEALFAIEEAALQSRERHAA